MPAACGQCGFMHRPESSCPEELDPKDNLDLFIEVSSPNLKPITAEKSTEPMGLLSKYKPRDNGNLKQFKRREFLKKEHFPASGQLSATILELRDAFEGSYSDLLLDIKCGKVEYTVGIKFDSVLLDQIVNELGQDEKRWRGKQVVFELAKGKYINLQRERAKASSRPAKRKSAKR